MAVTRFDPFRELAVLHDRMNRMFGDQYMRRDDDVTSQGTWLPTVDIYETDNHDIVLKAELPDMNRDEIEVTVENNTLTLKGNKKLPAGVKEEQYRRIERNYGTFSRSFTLPSTVDAQKIKADFDKGVLTVRMPKTAQAPPRGREIPIGGK